MRSAATLAFAAPTCVRVAGAVAHTALKRGGGVTSGVPGFESTPFRLASDTLIWVGVDGPMHPRTALIDAGAFDAPLAMSGAVAIRLDPWPKTDGGQRFSENDAVTTATGAILRLMNLSKPAGFGCLFTGAIPPFPLSHRVDAARTLAHACAAGEPDALDSCARQLLGVGAGLTPSGDDFVGGALFALRLKPEAARWEPVSRAVVAHARQRTHIISATLLADLANGQSYAALHAFSAAILRADADGALGHASELVSIGSSSGWDMLAGFFAALAGTLEIS